MISFPETPRGVALGDLFPGRGESAALMRAIDWSQTALGPTEAWPRSLRTIIPIMLASRFAMRVIWGPEFIFLYNDAYRPILGASKHPSAMASRTAESFHEVWDIVGPLFHAVYTGEAVALENTLLSLDRNGYLEECYFTLSYSPIADDDGKIAGLLGVVNETTDQVLSQRRFRTLRDLASIPSAPSATCALDLAATALGHNPADVPFALFYVIEPDGEGARLVARRGLDEHSQAAPSFVDLRAPFDVGWPLAAARAAPQVIADVRRRFGDLHAGPYPEPVSAALVVPIKRAGVARSHGFLVAGINPRRALDDAYLGFFDLASEHIVSAASEALDREELGRLTARQRAADERLRLLLNEAPAAIALVRGPELVYELANPLYCQLVGRSDLLGRRGREAVPELVDQGVWDLLDRVYETGEAFVAKELPVKLDRSGDGTLDLGYFNFIAQPMHDPDGPTEGVMIFVIEITEQVVMRQAEAVARAEAEEGRAERARLLQSERAARAEVERASHAKDEFLAIVSHELRNPLSAMLGWTRLLRGGALSEEQRVRGLETIERNAVNQSQLIEDLLDVSRIVSGQLRLDVKVVNFGDVVNAALDSARPAVEAKRLEMSASIDPDLLLTGDATRLQQVVWNLLTNATKFTQTGGSIQIDLRRADSRLELVVTDTGRGIGAAFLPYVFEAFKQGDGSTTRTQGGLGLGLSIAKNLVEMHGGTIAVLSEGKDRGSAFTVRLPVAPLRATPTRSLSDANPARHGPRWERPPEIAGLRVLVVDDERDARDLIETVLEYCGAVVEHASSPREALEKLDSWRPDVLLSDIGMPDEDGYSLIRQVRSRSLSDGGSTPVASLTGYAGADDRRRALHAGFNMHVAKPIEPAELVAVVANLARLARLLK